MRSASSSLIKSAMDSTKLSEAAIKRYIRHKKKRVDREAAKVQGAQPQRKKKERQKRVRAYELCVSSQMMSPDLKGLTQGEKMKIANAYWNSLSDEEKDGWQEKAKIENQHFKKPGKSVTKVIKMLKDECKKLWDRGVLISLVVPPLPGKEEINVHYPPGMAYIWSSPLAMNLYQQYGEEISRRMIPQADNINHVAEAGPSAMDVAQSDSSPNVQVPADNQSTDNAPQNDSPQNVQGAEESTVDMTQNDSSQNVQGMELENDAQPVESSYVDMASVPVHLVDGHDKNTSVISFGIQGTCAEDDDQSIVTVPHMTKDEAFARAKELAKQAEQKKSGKRSKPGRPKKSLVGRKFKQLWDMEGAKTRQRRKWYYGDILKLTEDTYSIKFKDKVIIYTETEENIREGIKKKTVVML